MTKNEFEEIEKMVESFFIVKNYHAVAGMLTGAITSLKDYNGTISIRTDWSFTVNSPSLYINIEYNIKSKEDVIKVLKSLLLR